MIGILIAAHQDMGPALRRAAEGILGPMERVEALSLDCDTPPAQARRSLGESLRRLDAGEGVLVLTDMFGGTPTNVSLPLAEAGRVEVITGVNLPMVLKAQTARREMELGQLAVFLREYGARNIVLAREVCTGRPCVAN